MFSYVTDELPALVGANFPTNGRFGVTGHSMGGHGALVVAQRRPDVFKSVSAFAPISHPSHCPWGVKAFGGYLGEDKRAWAAYDATDLMASGAAKGAFDDILIDVGTADKFYEEKQLLPEDFKAAADAVGQKVTMRMMGGYDHSYFFVATFVDDHVAHHAARLA